ncbi:dehydrogenase [Flagelloscypha sp. PMI_526]|nr:dehydrogenase [Flagelloscypha sp. PMI_526]
MASYLVTGTSRGLGLGLVTFLAAKPSSEVSLIFAAARKATPALTELVEAHQQRVYFVELNLEVFVGREKGESLDILVNNAGVTDARLDRIETMDELEETFRINVFGTHLVTAAFLPLLRKGVGKKIVNISSTVGSLALVESFSEVAKNPAYKISKAALNMLSRQYALDLRKEGFVVFSLSPGWVKTDLGTAYAELTVEQSVAAVYEILTTAGKDENGRFLNVKVEGFEHYQGGEAPW